MRDTASVGEARATLARRLAEARIATPTLDARLLVETATGLSHEQLVAEAGRPITEDEDRCLEQLANRRLQGEPISRLRGEREFYGLPFFIDASTLDPRSDTETLVELGLAFAAGKGSGIRILDLGTGSGAVAVSLLFALPHAIGTATDIDSAALAVARRNADRHGVAGRLQLRKTNWCNDLAGAYDLIISNPPYIASASIGGLAPEVARFDPRVALDGGPDGLCAYRAIAGGASDVLAPNGLLAVEIGAGHENHVTSTFRQAGWRQASGDFASCRDLAGHVRVLGFERP